MAHEKRKRPVKKSKKVKEQAAKTERPKIISPDDVYRLINRVQLQKKEATFAVCSENAPSIENVVRDLGIPYSKREFKSKTIFNLVPVPDEVFDDDRIQTDQIEDEVLEDGQLF